MSQALSQPISSIVVEAKDQIGEALEFDFDQSVLKVGRAQALPEAVQDRLHELLEPNHKWILILRRQDQNHVCDTL